ncbi:hypothetical protein PNOK_0294900 [Pyrrhoderma noxium]|uniref:Uncharacterized protein n=1 Tax=Pyrrhoderma noxium TaxID=2282107 RepID=A0A286UL78_9AGAM|nr:hypothetical protein PNOK_0294900 [Pyrrhoderma noxium]
MSEDNRRKKPSEPKERLSRSDQSSTTGGAHQPQGGRPSRAPSVISVQPTDENTVVRYKQRPESSASLRPNDNNALVRANPERGVVQRGTPRRTESTPSSERALVRRPAEQGQAIVKRKEEHRDRDRDRDRDSRVSVTRSTSPASTISRRSTIKSGTSDSNSVQRPKPPAKEKVDSPRPPSRTDTLRQSTSERRSSAAPSVADRSDIESLRSVSRATSTRAPSVRTPSTAASSVRAPSTAAPSVRAPSRASTIIEEPARTPRRDSTPKAPAESRPLSRASTIVGPPDNGHRSRSVSQASLHSERKYVQVEDLGSVDENFVVDEDIMLDEDQQIPEDMVSEPIEFDDDAFEPENEEEDGGEYEYEYEEDENVKEPRSKSSQGQKVKRKKKKKISKLQKNINEERKVFEREVQSYAVKIGIEHAECEWTKGPDKPCKKQKDIYRAYMHTCKRHGKVTMWVHQYSDPVTFSLHMTRLHGHRSQVLKSAIYAMQVTMLSKKGEITKTKPGALRVVGRTQGSAYTRRL